MPALGVSLGTPFSRKAGPLTPPTLAPSLMVLTGFPILTDAELAWTASNKTGSAGFGYRIYRKVAAGSFTELATTTGLTYTDSVPAASGEDYFYYVKPYNNAGEGPASNTDMVILPGS